MVALQVYAAETEVPLTAAVEAVAAAGGGGGAASGGAAAAAAQPEPETHAAAAAGGLVIQSCGSSGKCGAPLWPGWSAHS